MFINNPDPFVAFFFLVVGAILGVIGGLVYQRHKDKKEE